MGNGMHPLISKTLQFLYASSNSNYGKYFPVVVSILLSCDDVLFSCSGMKRCFRGLSGRLYDECLGDWHSLSMQVMNHAGVVTEKVWYNFEPGQVHWHRLAGS